MSSRSTPSREKYRALLSTASKTAGSDNWKTSAGRIEGSDGFEPGDAWRLLKLHFKGTSKPPVCPVCMDRPKSDSDWHITKSCKHAVCRECLQDYAASLISDPNHSGPLKCPCCPRLLRVEDAKVALDKQRGFSVKKSVSLRNIAGKASMKRVPSKGGLFAEPENNVAASVSLLEKWDDKTRNEFLRSMKDFRPCPHCGQGKNNSEGDALSPGIDQKSYDTSDQGGGFVTPECLAPSHVERESKAERVLCMAGTPSSRAVLMVYVIYYLSYTGSSAAPEKGHSSVAVQILLALIPALLLPILPHVIGLALATIAKREIMRPIIVTCPCCSKDFNLEASSEFQLADSSSDNAAEAATKRWKNSNTRPCPGCSSPIEKDGGCNHVKCGRCRADFCWACMRSRTSCQAYRCKNGAPFGNAFGDGSLVAVRAGLDAAEHERQAGRSLVERIEHIETVAIRNLRLFQAFPIRYAAMTGIMCMALSCLTSSRGPMAAVWIAIQGVVSLGSISLSLLLRLTGAVIVYSLILYETRRLQRRNNGAPILNNHRAGVRANPQNRRHRDNNMRRRRMPSLLRLSFRTEEEQFAEAIARSLREQ